LQKQCERLTTPPCRMHLLQAAKPLHKTGIRLHIQLIQHVFLLILPYGWIQRVNERMIFNARCP